MYLFGIKTPLQRGTILILYHHISLKCVSILLTREKALFKRRTLPLAFSALRPKINKKLSASVVSSCHCPPPFCIKIEANFGSEVSSNMCNNIPFTLGICVYNRTLFRAENCFFFSKS